MHLVIRDKSLINLLLIFGFLTVPISMLVTKTLYLAIYASVTIILGVYYFKNLKIKNLIIFLISIIYLIFTGLLRPDNVLISVRFFALILIILIAFDYSNRCKTKDLLKLVKVIFILGFFSAIVGLKQFIFGYSDLDIKLLFFQGSGGIVQELTEFGISRSLGITFGALSQGILLSLTLHSIILLNKLEKKIFIKILYFFCFILILFSLIATLNRTSIVAIAASMIIYLNSKNIFNFFVKSFFSFQIFVIIIFFGLVYYFLNFSEFENVIIGIKGIFKSLGIIEIDPETDDFFSQGKSFQLRLRIILNILANIVDNPFGFKSYPEGFSIDDIGIFSLFIKYGIFGGLIIVLIIFLPIIGLIKFFILNNKDNNNDIVKLVFGFYIITVITNSISFSLDGTVTMLPFWLIIGLSYNLTFFKKRFSKF